MRQKIIQNMTANFAAAFVNVAMPLIMLPLYLNYLGIKQWGAISLAFLIQSLIAVIDSGLSQALTREFAAKSKDLSRLRTMYSTCAIANGTLVCTLSIIVLGFVEVSNFFFVSNSEMKREAWIYGVALFGISSISSVSRSLLIAIERQVLASGINIFFVFFRYLVALLLVREYKTIESFFWAQIFMQGMESIARFLIAHKILKLRVYIFDYATFNEVKGFVQGVLIAVIIGALTYNLERFIVSFMASLEQFGIYSIAAILGTGVIQLIYPITQAFFPSLMHSNIRETRRILLRLIFGATVILIFCWWGYCLYGKTFLEFYLKTADVEAIHFLLTIYLAGSSVNFFWNIVQLMVMREGNHRLIAGTSIVNLIIIALCTPVIMALFGTKFTPFVFLITNIVGLIAAAIYTLRVIKREYEV